MTRRILSAPATAPAKDLLLVVQRGRSLFFYAAKGTTPVPLPDFLPESVPIRSEAEGTGAASNHEKATPVPTHEQRIHYEVRLCLSAESILYRSWHFPFTGTSKIRQALRLALASELPFPDNELQHALFIQKAPAGKHHTQTVSASIKKNLLNDVKHSLLLAGLEPDCITFDPFPALEKNAADAPPCLDVFLRADHAVLLRRTHGIVEAIQVTSTGWKELCPAPGETQARFVELTRKFSAAQAFSRLGLTPDRAQAVALYNTLHQDAQAMPNTSADMPLNMHADVTLSPFSDEWPLSNVSGNPVEALQHMRRPVLSLPTGRPHSGTRHWKTAALLYAFAVCSSFFALWGETRFQERRTLHLEQTAIQLFRTSLPELSSRSFGMVQMESILRQRTADKQATSMQSKGASVVALLEALHRATPDTLDVRVNSIRVNLTRKDSRICTLSCTAPDYETAGRLKDALEALPEVENAQVRNAVQTTTARTGSAALRGVQFELELRLKQENS